MSNRDPNRRSFVSGLVAAASAASIGCEPLTASERDDANLFLRRMIMGIELDAIIDGDWRLSDAIPPRAGAVILNLTHSDGQVLRVDVCRRDEVAFGPAATDSFDLIVMDGGGGEAVYDDDFLMALMVLADSLQQNDYSYCLSESLLSHSERLHAFPDVMSCAATELIPTHVAVPS